jgi:Flp pilus assembly protein CpaB
MPESTIIVLVIAIGAFAVLAGALAWAQWHTRGLDKSDHNL